MKFAIIGLVLGAFLAAFVLVVIYLMSGKLQSTEQFREEFGMPLLGQITKNPEKKRLFGFIDRWFQHMEEGAYADVTYEEPAEAYGSQPESGSFERTGLEKNHAYWYNSEGRGGSFLRPVRLRAGRYHFLAL